VPQSLEQQKLAIVDNIVLKLVTSNNMSCISHFSKTGRSLKILKDLLIAQVEKDSKTSLDVDSSNSNTKHHRGYITNFVVAPRQEIAQNCSQSSPRSTQGRQGGATLRKTSELFRRHK
jgi:hypothetical protein